MAIVVSHIGTDFDALAKSALVQAELADLIELRLDHVGHPGKERLAAFVRAAPKPVIITCRTADAYGAYTGSLEQLLELYHDAAAVGARFVDIDWTLSLELGEVEAPCHRIVSRHETSGTPEDLDALLSDVQEVLYEGDLTKIVTYAHSTEDGLRLLAWLRKTKGIISFCAGDAGRFTRLLAPIFGSPFTYCAPSRRAHASTDASERTAPGQWPLGDFLAQLPPGGISQETAIFGVVGSPVGQSWSPWVHGMALKAAHLDAVYVAFEPADFTTFLALTEDENYRGFSVTAPFKEEARRLAARCDEAGERTGAINTLVREPAPLSGGTSVWSGHNTDVGAVRETLQRALEIQSGAATTASQLAALRVLVVGTGGAARAAIWAARSVECSVTIAGRQGAPEAARALAEEFGCESTTWEGIQQAQYEVLIHATPLGSLASDETRDRLPVPAEWIRPGSVVLDAVYRPIRTPLLAAAHEQDCICVPGGEWFVRQAMSQFKLFTGAEPDGELMRKSFEHAHETQRG